MIKLINLSLIHICSRCRLSTNLCVVPLIIVNKRDISISLYSHPKEEPLITYLTSNYKSRKVVFSQATIELIGRVLKFMRLAYLEKKYENFCKIYSENEKWLQVDLPVGLEHTLKYLGGKPFDKCYRLVVHFYYVCEEGEYVYRIESKKDKRLGVNHRNIYHTNTDSLWSNSIIALKEDLRKEGFYRAQEIAVREAEKKEARRKEVAAKAAKARREAAKARREAAKAVKAVEAAKVVEAKKAKKARRVYYDPFDREPCTLDTERDRESGMPEGMLEGMLEHIKFEPRFLSPAILEEVHRELATSIIVDGVVALPPAPSLPILNIPVPPLPLETITLPEHKSTYEFERSWYELYYRIYMQQYKDEALHLRDYVYNMAYNYRGMPMQESLYKKCMALFTPDIVQVDVNYFSLHKKIILAFCCDVIKNIPKVSLDLLVPKLEDAINTLRQMTFDEHYNDYFELYATKIKTEETVSTYRCFNDVAASLGKRFLTLITPSTPILLYSYVRDQHIQNMVRLCNHLKSFNKREYHGLLRRLQAQKDCLYDFDIPPVTPIVFPLNEDDHEVLFPYDFTLEDISVNNVNINNLRSSKSDIPQDPEVFIPHEFTHQATSAIPHTSSDNIGKVSTDARTNVYVPTLQEIRELLDMFSRPRNTEEIAFKYTNVHDKVTTEHLLKRSDNTTTIASDNVTKPPQNRRERRALKFADRNKKP